MAQTEHDRREGGYRGVDETLGATAQNDAGDEPRPEGDEEEPKQTSSPMPAANAATMDVGNGG